MAPTGTVSAAREGGRSEATARRGRSISRPRSENRPLGVKNGHDGTVAFEGGKQKAIDALETSMSTETSAKATPWLERRVEGRSIGRATR
jgi:hypothetical protein